MAVITITTILPTNNDLQGNTASANSMKDFIDSYLSNNRWKVINSVIVPFADYFSYTVNVTGSDNDNLKTVVSSFNKTLAKYNVKTTNTTARTNAKNTKVIDTNQTTKVINQNQQNTNQNLPVVDTDSTEKGIVEHISEYFGGAGIGLILVTSIALLVVITKDRK